MDLLATTFTFEVSLLKVPVTDIARSVAFYRDALCFSEEFVAEEYGWAQLSSGSLRLALYVPGMGGGNATVGESVGFHLALPAAEFDSLAQQLLDRGSLEEDRVHQGNDGTTFMDVNDPDGNILKIMRTN